MCPCACVLTEDGSTVASPCGAHMTWVKELLQRTTIYVVGDRFDHRSSRWFTTRAEAERYVGGERGWYIDEIEPGGKEG